MNDRISRQRYSPLGQLVLARLREFYREPEAVFWVYGFPILCVALGIAFRNKPVEHDRRGRRHECGVARPGRGAEEAGTSSQCRRWTKRRGRLRLRTGKTELVVVPGPSRRAGGVRLYDPTRPESRIARESSGRRACSAMPAAKMSLAHTSIRNRMSRAVATSTFSSRAFGHGPDGRRVVGRRLRDRRYADAQAAQAIPRHADEEVDFLAAIMISRLLFMVPEVLDPAALRPAAFGVMIAGQLAGGACSGAARRVHVRRASACLVASRAKTTGSGFGSDESRSCCRCGCCRASSFRSERFPGAAQPFIKSVPLTPLINALRAVMLEGASLPSQLPEIAILFGWGVLTFVLACAGSAGVDCHFSTSAPIPS